MGLRLLLALAFLTAGLAGIACEADPASDTKTTPREANDDNTSDGDVDKKSDKKSNKNKPVEDFKACAQLSPTAEAVPDSPPPGSSFLVGFNDRLWRNGQTLIVVFLDGNKAAWQKAAEHAREWTRHANLRLRFFSRKKPPRMSTSRCASTATATGRCSGATASAPPEAASTRCAWGG